MIHRGPSTPVAARRRTILTLCVALGICTETYVLGVYAPDRVVSRGSHLAPVHEFNAGAVIRQTFACTANGLNRIDVMFSAAQPASVWVAWELVELRTPDAIPVIRGRRRLDIPSGAFWQEIRFPPVAASAARSYALEMRLDTANSSRGADVALAVSLDNPLRGGYLAVGGVPRWGDLVFEARAKGDTIAGRFALQVLPGLRWPFTRPATWVVLLAVLNLLVGVVMAGVAFPAPEPPTRRSPS